MIDPVEPEVFRDSTKYQAKNDNASSHCVNPKDTKDHEVKTKNNFNRGAMLSRTVLSHTAVHPTRSRRAPTAQSLVLLRAP